MNSGDEVRVFVASRRKWLVVFAVGALFVVLALGELLQGISTVATVVGVVGAAIFGLGCAVSLWQLTRPGRLELGSTSFDVVVSGGRRTTFEWKECGEFQVWSMPPSLVRLVVFDCADAGSARLIRMNRRLTGGSASLPDTYGMTARDLAGVMNEARRRAMESL